VLVIHGPNLNLLGRREPGIYGHETLEAIDLRLRDLGAELGVAVDCVQHNGEGDIVTAIQGAPGRYAGIVINPAAYTHTSVAVRDALAAVGEMGVPAVEVHLSQPAGREDFRRVSLVAPVCRGSVSGFGAEGAAVTGPEDVRYLSGFRGDAGLLFVGRDDAALLTDSRFWIQAEEEAPGFRLVRVAGRDTAEFLADACRQAAVAGLAFDPEHLSHAAYRAWRRALSGVRLVPVPGLVGRLRLRKDPDEVGAIRRAAALADLCFAEWLPQVVPGAVERDLALDLEVRLRRAGAEGVSFPPIVAGGPRGAMAHAIPGPDALRPGDMVVVDLGCRLEGYCSDMTRTVVVPGAAPDPEAMRVYDVVRRALEAGLAALEPGRSGVEVDAAARAVIAAAGYGEAFGHGLGHGVGLAVHEGPRLSPRADPRAPIPEDAVVTVEPGIYLAGRFGVRLEQLARVRAGGPELLSRSPL
jgi:3-dehydroquinate dehydratase type II